MSPEDIAPITRLKYEYCYTIDDGRYDEWVSLFTDDGRFVRANGDAYEGHDEIRGFATEVFDTAFDYSAHVVTNPLIDIDGDSATGRWYLVLYYRTADGAVGWTQATYHDEYRHEDGEWRIAAAEVTGGVDHRF